MRFLDRQVHLAELALLAVFSVLSFLIGYSLPLMALILLVTWPLLLIQMLFEGFIFAAFAWFRKRKEPDGPPCLPRLGLARYIWFTPLITLTVGYMWYVIETGKWGF